MFAFSSVQICSSVFISFVIILQNYLKSNITRNGFALFSTYLLYPFAFSIFLPFSEKINEGQVRLKWPRAVCAMPGMPDGFAIGTLVDLVCNLLPSLKYLFALMRYFCSKHFKYFHHLYRLQT